MFAFGVFFDRFGDEKKIDFFIPKEQVEQLMSPYPAVSEGALGSSMLASITANAICSEFESLQDLVARAQEGNPIILNEEEWVIVLASSREKAKKAFTAEYMEGFE